MECNKLIYHILLLGSVHARTQPCRRPPRTHAWCVQSERVERNNIWAIDPARTGLVAAGRLAPTDRPSGPGRQRGARRRRPPRRRVRVCVHACTHSSAALLRRSGPSPSARIARIKQLPARRESPVDRPRNNLPPGRRIGRGRRTCVYVRAVRARRHGGTCLEGPTVESD